MTIQDSLFNIATDHDGLFSLIASRFYPSIAPQNVVTPYCVYQRVSNVPVSLLSSDTDATESRFQVDCYADAYDDATDVAEQLKLAFRRLSGTYAEVPVLDCFIENENDLYDDDNTLFRISIDIMIQYRVITV